jgi:hypothetical protein
MASKARFPAFNALDNAVVTSAIAEAGRLVDQSWTDGDFTLAQMLYACHVMTLDGLGNEGAAGIDLPYGVKTLQAGDTKIERFASTDPGASAYGSTSYGQRFMVLRRRNITPVLSTSDYPSTVGLCR